MNFFFLIREGRNGIIKISLSVEEDREKYREFMFGGFCCRCKVFCWVVSLV